MKKTFIRILLTSISLSLFSLFVFSCDTTNSVPDDSNGDTPDASSAITSDEIAEHNGFTYEFWSQNGTGSGSMTLKEGATFDIQWSGIENLLARIGVRPGDVTTNVNYTVNYNPDGNSYMCIYGWTQNELIEYYIVDNWGSWRPPGSGYKTTVTIDGADYDIYETTRNNQPSIEGNTTFQQYWSVRQTKRSSGMVDISKHFDAWEEAGMSMGSSLYEVSFCIEGYRSSGTAEVTELTFTTD